MASNAKQIVESPSVLTLDTTSNSTTFTINNKVPIQTLTLEQVRVQYDSAAEAVTAGVIYVDIPFFSSDNLNDGTNYFNLPILLDNNVVTLQQTNIPVHLSRKIEEKFVMSVRDASGTLVAGGFARITLQFRYSLVENN